MFSGSLKSFVDFVNLIQLDLSGTHPIVTHYLSANFSWKVSHAYHNITENDLEGKIPTDFLASISARKPIEVDLSSNSLSGGVPPNLDR